MDKARFELAQDFIWKNARLLDRRIFVYLFANPADRPTARQAVVTALKAYQNPDGGFGSGLEADIRGPDSQPVAVDFALGVLDLAGALEDPVTIQEVILPACAFLQKVSTPAGGVPTVLEAANRYPHAPWWEVTAPLPATLNPTAGIAGKLLKHGIRHPWLTAAEAFCWREIPSFHSEAYHDLMPVIEFLECTPDRARAEIELNRIAGIIRKPGVVELDPQAGGYVKLPLDWAPTPDSTCRRLFEDATLRHHLADLEAKQLPDGGWPINWDALSPAVALEWRGWVTILALHTLQAYEAAGF